MDTTILDSLDKIGICPVLERPDGFGITVKEYMQEKNCGEAIARSTLAEAVKAGVLVVHKMRKGAGCHPLVFHRPLEWPPKGLGV
jgi:hypothetical protein